MLGQAPAPGQLRVRARRVCARGALARAGRVCGGRGGGSRPLGLGLLGAVEVLGEAAKRVHARELTAARALREFVFGAD